MAWGRLAGPCDCGAPLEPQRDEAILDLEVRTAVVPKAYFDLTVRHSVPSEGERLTVASNQAGAVSSEAECDKRHRYPDGRTPWRVVPLAVETYGRHGPAALKHLRQLARKQAAQLEEGGDQAVSALVQRRCARLSVALHRSNAARSEAPRG